MSGSESQQNENNQNENNQIDSSTQVAENQVELSLNDLMSLKLILQVSTRRGTWLAEELEDVGKLYKRLSAFLDRVVPKDGENANAEQGSSVEGTSVEGTSGKVPDSNSEKIVI